MLSCIFSDGYCAELRSAIPGVFYGFQFGAQGRKNSLSNKQSVAVERDDEHHTSSFLCVPVAVGGSGDVHHDCLKCLISKKDNSITEVHE
jgi:hypothetical protein